MRIGLLGGTFDPVHKGHTAIAAAARDTLQLDRIYFIPALISPHKAGTKPTGAEHRLAMLQRALADDADFFLSDIELRREGPSYTIDTVRTFREKFPEPEHQLFLIIGSDNLAGFPYWRNWDEILRLAQLVVYPRGGHAEDSGAARQAELPHLVIPAPEIDIAASEIRASIRDGRDVSHCLHPEVLNYIEENALYRGA
ncbi:MAG TPA: nicotinate (nicotinamide) nucleotide adenylyltransferase [Bacteroidetes bacterium]|nr:nicotinate (nicotinamide) nucleotide adenylyltransferase [Bacteroidota bacterium]